ncbi:hypothetical protein ACHAO4_003289 [Trichoderma viride]
MTLYPGLGLPLRYYPLEYAPREDDKFYPLGLHANCYDSCSALLPVREVAMMNIMEQLTDKENWHNMIFNDEVVDQWRKEALEQPNRVYWKQATDNKGSDAVDCVPRPPGIMDVPTFDYCVKELRDKANYYAETGIIPTLEASAAIAKSDVLVSVSLRAELQEAFKKLKLDQRLKPNWHPKSNEQVLDLVHPSMYSLVYGQTRVLQDEVVGTSDAIDKWAGKGEPIAKDTSNSSRDEPGSPPPASYWSETYQWLPANVKFMEDGTVKFTSYINNLHPQKYPQVYRTIEKLIEAALPAWDQCLSLRLKGGKKSGAGRTEPRFPKQDMCDNVSDIWDPSSPPPLDDVDEDDGEDGGGDNDEAEDEEEDDEDDEDPAILEWKETRNPVHPRVPEFEDVEYAQRDIARLAHKFKKAGLQVIVKMVSIELTPEKPELPAGEWHVSKERSRSQRTHGTSLRDGWAPCLQMYGAVQMHEGRLLTFPSVFQHKESSIKLKDPSKPGTRHVISLQLVDPSMRIISTANVPPQQRDWWLGAVLRQPLRSDGSTLANLPPDLVAILEQKNMSGGELSVEILDMVRAHLHNDESFLPMTEEEARKHRAELLQDRIEHHTRADISWADTRYFLFRDWPSE